MTTEKMFKTPKLLQDAIEDYFDNGVNEKEVLVGRDMVKVPVPTITGLVLHLGFCDRASFYDYEKYDGYSHTIKRARTFIESHYEELLQVGNTTGAIFALKNFGWTDKSEIATTDITPDAGKIVYQTEDCSVKADNPE